MRSTTSSYPSSSKASITARKHITSWIPGTGQNTDGVFKTQASTLPRRNAAVELDIRAWEDAYLRDGHFNQQRMLALIENVLIGGKAQGYPLTRLVANMEWALEDRPGVEDLVEYETRLNYILPKYDDAVC